jgi:hypothetical protein
MLGALRDPRNIFKGELRDATEEAVVRDLFGVEAKQATPDQIAQARAHIMDWVESSYTKTENEKAIIDLRERIRSETTTLDEKITLSAELERRMHEKLAENIAQNPSIADSVGTAYSKIVRPVVEWAQGTVLGPSSLIANLVGNTINAVIRPFLTYVSKGPFDRAAFREMTQHYSALTRVHSGFLNAAKMSFEIEKSLLLGESPWLSKDSKSVFNNGDNKAMNFIGRNYVRMWLRLLTSTDEMAQQLIYRGHVEGTAAYNAATDAVTKGLKGKEFDDHVRKSVEEAVGKAYKQSIDDNVIRDVREAGLNKGYRDEKLDMYIKNTIENNPSLYTKATNQASISHTEDVLFKKAFSGEGSVSGLAKQYESIVQRYPLMKIAGQLFFRTPVRVFETGIRLTPGLQLMAPNFLRDLQGLNGTTKQIRAYGETYAAYAFTLGVMTAWSTGKITGDGGNMDYRVKRSLENGKLFEPYSFRIGDTSISYRNYDPISTPIKIIVNALERLEFVEFQRAQGVYNDKGDNADTIAHMSIALTATAQAFRDASLTSGFDDLLKLTEALADPERNENAITKFFGSKAQLAVPNVLRKEIRSFGEGQNTQTDPQTIEQMLRVTINPLDPKVTQQYDALGHPRNTGYAGALGFLGINVKNKLDKARGLSDRDLESLDEISKLSYATGKTFVPNFKSKEWYGNKDLREVMTADGSTTVYNKAMQEYRNLISGPAYSFFKGTQSLPSGHRGMVGERATAFESMSNELWNAALAKTLASDSKAIEERARMTTSNIRMLSGGNNVASPLGFR